jgi:hypothetical protein
MGCGKSRVQDIQKKQAASDDLNYDALMDKKIPNYFIEDGSNDNLTEEDGKGDLKADDLVSTL